MANGSVIRMMRRSVWVCLLASTSQTASSQPADDPVSLFQLVRSQIELGHYVEAEAEAERLLSGVRESSDPARLDGRVVDLLVEARLRNGRGAERRTRELAELSVETGTLVLGAGHPSLATSVRNLGDVLLHAGDFEPATQRLREALTLIESAPNAAPSDVAEVLDRLALTLKETGQYDEALQFANRALALREQEPDPTGVPIARTLHVRGLVLQAKGDFAKARPDFERALTLQQAAHPQHPETAVLLTSFGLGLFLEGDLQEARHVLGRAVSIAETTLRPDHPDIASSLQKLADPLTSLGDLAGARSSCERALAIAEKAFGSDHPRVADPLNDLANSLLLQGEFSLARPLYERSLAIVERRFGPNHFAVGTRVYNLAILHRRLADLNEARRQFERAIQIWTRTGGPEHPSVARAYSALAETLADQGLHSEARTYFERALAIRERALGPNHPLVAVTLSSLSVSLVRLGFADRAAELSARSVQIGERSGALQDLADSLEVHARLLVEQGEQVGALNSFQRALEIRRPLLGTSHPSIAQTEVALASLEARMDNRQEAFGRALRSEGISRDHLRLTLGSLAERQGLDFAARRPQGLELALSMAADVPGSSRPLLDALILGRSLILDEMAARRQALAGAAGGLGPLWINLGSARQRLANLIIRGPNSNQRPGQYSALIDEARREKELAERALADESASFREELERAEIGLEQVLRSLMPGNGLVSFVRYERTVFSSVSSGAARPASATPTRPPRTVPSYLAFVLRQQDVDPILVPLGTAEAIDSLIASWRRVMMADIARPAGAPPPDQSFRAVGTALRRAIWDPIAPHLSDVSRVFVVPDGAINLVPLAALPAARTGYLLEDGPVIHYVSAERDLVRSAEPKHASGTGLLVVGGPSFTDTSSFASLTRPARPAETRVSNDPLLALSSATRPVAALRSAPPGCVGFQSMQFGPLPGSRREAETVADLWQQMARAGTSATQLIGRDATEGAFKQLAPGRSVLHIGTHGFYLGDECDSSQNGTRAVGGLTSAAKSAAVKRPGPPSQGTRESVQLESPLIRSGLALAGANRRSAAGPEEDDGILTGEEVAALNLEGLDWAVLSACKTGLGEVRAGEGVLGLRRAFHVAGARTIIMSLWSVEDRATRQWMEALYRGRLGQGLDTADAVRQASLTVLRDRRARKLSTHPFYWAAFVAAGDWR